MRRAPACVLATLLLLALAPRAGAAFIPWKYNWSRDPAVIYSDTSKQTYITLTDEKLSNAAGSSDIVATNIKTYSNANPDHPKSFTHKDYTLTLFLLDVQSGKSGTMAFTGFLDGSVSSASSEFENTFTNPTTQTLDLGGHQYKVTINSFTPPGPPDAANSGAISAHATVRVSDIQKSPEPSTLLLAGLGSFSLMGYRVWRRRRPA